VAYQFAQFHLARELHGQQGAQLAGWNCARGRRLTRGCRLLLLLQLLLVVLLVVLVLGRLLLAWARVVALLLVEVRPGRGRACEQQAQAGQSEQETCWVLNLDLPSSSCHRCNKDLSLSLSLSSGGFFLFPRCKLPHDVPSASRST